MLYFFWILWHLFIVGSLTNLGPLDDLLILQNGPQSDICYRIHVQKSWVTVTIKLGELT